jgi:phenylalanyl-tRNA synthetase beta chain
VEAEVRGTLTACGFDEAVTFSLVADSLAAPLSPLASEPIRVDHSSRKRENALRQSLIPSLLAVRRHNEAHGDANAELFEIANVYLPKDDASLPDEPTRLALVGGHDYYGLKGVVEAVIERLHVADRIEFQPVHIAPFASGRAGEILLDEVHLGYLGEIDRARRDELELRGDCSAAELAFDVLVARANLVAQNSPLPSFPMVARDLSLVVARSLPWSDLSAAVTTAAGPTLESVTYLDTFRGGNLADDRQSVHFGMKFRHRERTLTGDEVERAIKAVVDACAARFEATLRS